MAILLVQELQQQAACSGWADGEDWCWCIVTRPAQATSRGQCGVKWGPGAGHWAPGTLAQAGTLAPVRGGGSGLHTTTPPPPPPRHTAACI